MKITGRLLWLLLLSFTVALAQEEPRDKDKDKDKGAEKKSAPEKPEKEKEPVLSVTEHELTVDGKVIKYRATAGYMLMKDAKNEKAKANIFFIAYTKLDDGANKVDPAKR
ncbi:MAG: Peptidase, partial [Lacunisphaera sp.]|nr:Peptidase [Lacunisphaera sp.]